MAETANIEEALDQAIEEVGVKDPNQITHDEAVLVLTLLVDS